MHSKGDPDQVGCEGQYLKARRGSGFPTASGSQPLSSMNAPWPFCFDDTFSFPQTRGVHLSHEDCNGANVPSRHLTTLSTLSSANYSTYPTCTVSNPSLTTTALYYDKDTEYAIGHDGRHVSSVLDAYPSFNSRMIRSPVGDTVSVGSPMALTPSEPDQAAAMLCKWEGCKFDGFFSREVDLLRHLRCVHISPGSYPCPAEGCYKSFNRKDNRDAHFRRLHDSGEGIVRNKDWSQKKREKKKVLITAGEL